jgi:glyoxylase-like metal-dependent hydrolase (beta-lactamase superfamily II)
MSDPVRPFTGGRVECLVVPDGTLGYRPESLYSDLAAEDTAAAVGGLVDDQGLIPVPYHPVLVRTADGPVLLDAGVGVALAAEVGAQAGRLRAALAGEGVAAEDIRLVVLSHAHADHIGGLTALEGTERRLLFPNARHVIARAEFDYWTSGQAPADHAWMAELARLHLLPVERAGMLDLVAGELDVAPGIRVIPAPGHTPGHMAVSISAPTRQTVFVADAVLGELNFRHPDWTSQMDTDRPQAARTRRRLLDAAANDGAMVFGYHLWAPGVVERDAGAYRWSPAG